MQNSVTECDFATMLCQPLNYLIGLTHYWIVLASYYVNVYNMHLSLIQKLRVLYIFAQMILKNSFKHAKYSLFSDSADVYILAVWELTAKIKIAAIQRLHFSLIVGNNKACHFENNKINLNKLPQALFCKKMYAKFTTINNWQF